MKLRKIRIQGFKSLEDVTFEPSTNFSCLVGSNGAGKSNFCDAILFFKKVVMYGVSSAIEDFGNNENISNKEYISLYLEVDNLFYMEKYILEIDLKNKVVKKEKIQRLSLDENIPAITLFDRKNEKIEKIDLIKFNVFNTQAKSLLEDVSHRLYDLENKKNDATLKNNILMDELVKINDLLEVWKTIPKEIPKNFLDSNVEKLSEDKIGLAVFYDNLDVYKWFESFNIYRINPLAPKFPNNIFNKINLLTHGENLANILNELKNLEDSSKWEELIEMLNLIVPSINNLKINKSEFENKFTLNFVEGNREFNAPLISDGTIYTLAILTAVIWYSDKNTLIIIEEPERGIHPQAIKEIIGFMRSYSQDKLNILITTHSETVVRNCNLEELWITDKIESKTVIKSCKSMSPNLKEIPLDSAWLMNLFNGGLPW